MVYHLDAQECPARLSWGRRRIGAGVRQAIGTKRARIGRSPPSETSAGGSARAEGPGARRRSRRHHHCRRAAARSAPHLRQRGLRARDGVLGRRGAGQELPVPAGPRHRSCRGDGDPRGCRRRARVHRRDPELPAGRHHVLESAFHHAGPRRPRRGHPLHRRAVGRHRASRSRARAAARQGGTRTGPPAGGADPAGPAPAGGTATGTPAHRARVPSLHQPGRRRRGRRRLSSRLDGTLSPGRERARRGGSPPVVHPEPHAVASGGRIAPRRGRRTGALRRSAIARGGATQPAVPHGPDETVLHVACTGCSTSRKGDSTT